LRRFINERGKVLPQKYSGLTAKNQRLLAKEIKKARYMGLLPYTDRHAI
jgi:small subunit ribosomal protein S18